MTSHQDRKAPGDGRKRPRADGDSGGIKWKKKSMVLAPLTAAASVAYRRIVHLDTHREVRRRVDKET